MDFKKLSQQAKKIVDDRGGVGNLKADAEELKDIFKQDGSVTDKAKEAAAALKQPGAAHPSQATEPSGHQAAPQERAAGEDTPPQAGT